MAKCPWCKEWEGPPEKYSDHLQYCKKYPPNYEAIKERARIKHSSTTEELPPGIQEWRGIKGFSAVVFDGEFKWTVKLRDVAGNYITVTDVMTIAFEEFPEEPIPLIESIHIAKSAGEAFVTGFPPIHASAVTMVANFKGTARVRKELISLFFFLE